MDDPKDYSFWQVVFFFLTLAALPPEANAEQSSLLGLAQELHCSQTDLQASSLLKRLSELPLEPFGIPNEAISKKQDAELFAATVDILLKVLYETTQRFPKLQENAERIALRWNYCEILNEGDLADLMATKTGDFEKREAIGPFPANKQGFNVWGFLGKATGEHFVPETLKSPAIFPREYQDILQRVTRMQCFPRPDEERLKDEGNPRHYSGTLHLSEALEPGKKYPYSWQEHCAPEPVQNYKASPAKKQTLIYDSKNEFKPVPRQEVLVVEKPIEHPNKPLQKTIIAAPKTKAKPKAIGIPKKAVNKPKKSLIADLIAEKYVEPGKDESPVISPAVPSGNSNIGAVLPLPPAGGLGIAGNFYHRAKLTGELSFGANASWKPYSYFFVRGGVNYNYLPDSGKFSYSWGLGYDDWHPGTFSAQLNNWGPLEPGDDLLKGAVANFGYKFVADVLKPYHLTGSAALNVPLSGDPSLSTTWIWSPIEHWFVRASLSKSLVKTSGLDWSYSFGYSDWHPFTFSLTYDNWGTNPIFDSSQGNSFNFTENGAVSLSWSWAF